MNRTVVLLALTGMLIAVPLYALDVPPLAGHINDYAGMISPGMAAALEKKLAEFEQKDSTQIVVLIIPSLEGEVLEEYSIKVAESWKIGQGKLDNGVILLIAKKERKLRIEVGYGLEGKLTDLKAGRIIDRVITPRFKTGDFDNGIGFGVDAIVSAVGGEYTAAYELPEQAVGQESSWPIAAAVIGTIAALFAIVLLVTKKMYYRGKTGRGTTYAAGSGRSYGSSGSGSGYSGRSSGGGGFGGGGASGSW